MSPTGLEGRRCLVTGGAGAVGRAVGERLARAGARVLLADVQDATLAEALEQLTVAGVRPASVQTVSADLSTSLGVAHVFERVDQWLEGLDLLVACAGLGSGPLMEMPEDQWRRVIESNLVSYVACTQQAVERIRLSRGDGEQTGMVILVGSISVHIKAVGESLYNAAKGGVASFAETLRKELMTEAIRVTLIEPGAIASPMQSDFTSQERQSFVGEHRMLSPDDVADAILYAATRPPGVDVVTLRVEPLVQKIY